MMDNIATTNKDSYAKVDLENLTQICRGLNNEFIQTFVGFPIKVDNTLKGNEYYVAVSQKILEELEERGIK